MILKTVIWAQDWQGKPRASGDDPGRIDPTGMAFA